MIYLSLIIISLGAVIYTIYQTVVGDFGKVSYAIAFWTIVSFLGVLYFIWDTYIR